MRIVKVVKLEETENPSHPHNILVGSEHRGFFIDEPKIGEGFAINPVTLRPGERGFITSTVQEILSEDTFRTHNSIYRWSFEESAEEDLDSEENTEEELPKTLEEAVDFLIPKFEGMEEVFKKTEDSFAAYCHSQLSGGIGMQVRNQFGFWTKDSELYMHMKTKHRITEPDSMSDLILRHVYRKVNSK